MPKIEPRVRVEKAAEKTILMPVSVAESQMLLRLRQLRNTGRDFAGVRLPDLAVDERAIIELHGNV